MGRPSETAKTTNNVRKTTTHPEGSSMTPTNNPRTAKKPARLQLTEVIVAKKATACVSDRVNVSHPAETTVVYINDNEDGEGYVGWLARVAADNRAQEDCGALELANGKFFEYGDDIDDLSIELERHAYRLGFRFAQIIVLTEDPVEYSITEL